MTRKKKHDDDEDEADAMAAEGQPPEGEADEGPPTEAEEQPVAPEEPAAAKPAEAPAADEPNGKAEDGQQPATKPTGPKVYALEVRRNDSDWAQVAHTTVTTQPDHRDRQQAPVGYTKAQARQVEADWERAGYEVRLVELGKEPEPAPEPEPEPQPEQG